MKDKILFINACARENSRTKELSCHLLGKMNGEITEIDLYRENLLPLDKNGLEKRNLHEYSGGEFEYARQFKEADVIVIAAPFWDLSFPSVLKIYFENITVSGITFEYSQEGRPVGKCNAKKLYYITTLLKASPLLLLNSKQSLYQSFPMLLYSNFQFLIT